MKVIIKDNILMTKPDPVDFCRSSQALSSRSAVPYQGRVSCNVYIYIYIYI